MGNGLPEVAELFLELARVPSPSGEERVVADQVIEYLRALALPVDEDDAGARIDSSIGNLLCRIEPNGEGAPLFFCAHLDTVPPDGAIEPVVEDGVVRNAGGTILGADNKAGIAAMPFLASSSTARASPVFRLSTSRPIFSCSRIICAGDCFAALAKSSVFGADFTAGFGAGVGAAGAVVTRGAGAISRAGSLGPR